MAEPTLTSNCLECSENGHACLKNLATDQLKIVDKARTEVTFKKGEILFKQGAFASQIMFIRKGLVKIYLENTSRDLILKIVPEGNYLGLSSLFGKNVFHYTAAAYEPTSVCMIERETFNQMILENATFGAEIIKTLNDETIQSYDRLYSLTRKQLHGRLADILLCLANTIYKNDKFKIPISRKDLADLTSMATESVIRILKDFRNEGILSLSGKTLEIHDKDRLQKISRIG
ncbi:MAG: Crp/Fnr family transcriptional regulator [Bacteroidales bacterium]|nr:Crp/Fnr family transcriptional regulator [Bacteroidales bacterium]